EWRVYTPAESPMNGAAERQPRTVSPVYRAFGLCVVPSFMAGRSSIPGMHRHRCGQKTAQIALLTTYPVRSYWMDRGPEAPFACVTPRNKNHESDIDLAQRPGHSVPGPCRESAHPLGKWPHSPDGGTTSVHLTG